MNSETETPIAPPPLPFEPPPLPALPYATPLPVSDSPAARLAARASCLAPMLALLLALVAVALKPEQPSGPILLGAAALMILLGIAFAIVALVGSRGRTGILSVAVVGLVLNLLLIAGLVYATYTIRQTMQVIASTPGGATTWSNMRAPTSVAPAGPSVAMVQQQSREAIENYAGWVGADNRGNCIIVIAEWNDLAPGTIGMKSAFAADCKLISITLNNLDPSRTQIVDPASLEFHFTDYSTVKALPPMQILSTAKFDRDSFIKDWGKPRIVQPRMTLLDGAAFLPAGTDLRNARAVTVMLNDQRIVVQGKYLSVEEKAQRLEETRRARERGEIQ